MSDRLCQVCQEPWDSYGVRNGDMNNWQSDLFLKGAGCPCCKGGPDEPVTPTEQLADPSGSLAALGRPQWKRPAPKALWECEGCRVQAATDPDDGELTWEKGRNSHYYGGHAYLYGQLHHHDEPTAEPPHTIGGEHYCPGCAIECADCEVSIFMDSSMAGDTYAPGASFVPEGSYRIGSAVCVDCYENNHCDRGEE